MGKMDDTPMKEPMPEMEKASGEAESEPEQAASVETPKAIALKTGEF